MATCNCIADFNAKLAPEHELSASIAFNLSTGEMKTQTYTSLIRKSTGKPERRSNQPRLAAHSYCPFCGTSYSGPDLPEAGQ